MPLDQHSATCLLALALETYRKEIVPDLEPERRYAGAMIANAMEIAMRDLNARLVESEVALRLDAGGPACANQRELAKRIRRGEADIEEEALRRRLMDHLDVELAVRNPRFLKSRQSD